MDDAESFDSFIVAEPSSRKRKSLLPANKTANSTSSDLDILEEDQSTGLDLKILNLNNLEHFWSIFCDFQVFEHAL